MILQQGGAMEPGNPPQIGRNIQKIRKKHGMTLDMLSEKSGVSKAMLSQIESEKVNPTIATVWKIAQGLDVDISSLLTGQDELLRKFQVSREKEITRLDTDEEGVHIKVLSPITMAEDLEMYMLTFQPGTVLNSTPHILRTEEFLTVLSGRVRVTAGENSAELGEGDFIRYHVDIDHSIENFGKKEAVVYMVVRFQKAQWE